MKELASSKKKEHGKRRKKHSFHKNRTFHDSHTVCCCCFCFGCFCRWKHHATHFTYEPICNTMNIIYTFTVTITHTFNNPVWMNVKNDRRADRYMRRIIFTMDAWDNRFKQKVMWLKLSFLLHFCTCCVRNILFHSGSFCFIFLFFGLNEYINMLCLCVRV